MHRYAGTAILHIVVRASLSPARFDFDRCSKYVTRYNVLWLRNDIHLKKKLYKRNYVVQYVRVIDEKSSARVRDQWWEVGRLTFTNSKQICADTMQAICESDFQNLQIFSSTTFIGFSGKLTGKCYSQIKCDRLKSVSKFHDYLAGLPKVG